MRCWLGLVVLGVWLGTAVGMPMPTPATDDMSMDEIQSYFMKYGFMGKEMPDPAIAELVSTNMSMAYHYAIKIFQMRYSEYGLQETGELDAATMRLMSKPRCGVKDIMTMEDTGMDMRKKRYLLSNNRWEKLDLTYKITQYPRDRDLTPAQVDSEVARAFQVWADVTPLRFYRLEANSNQEIDIEIQFSVTGPQEHGDPYPFDGEHGTLAHAFEPHSNKLGGDAHFDEAEKWTVYTDAGYNLFQVAAHEFGHSLGLYHSQDPTALMAPFYAGYIENFVLPPDDIMGIQALYGRPEDRRPDTTTTTTSTPASTTPRRRTTPTTTPAPTMAPEGRDVCCEATFDAITKFIDNYEQKIYGFRGEYYFLIDEYGRIADGYPRRIAEGWPGLPNNIDAALAWEGKWVWSDAESRWVWNHPATFIFKGNQYWRVEDMTVAAGPRPVSDWGRNFPTDIDAALVWKNSGKTYFFKGNQYYRYTEGEGIDSNYPRPLSVWRGLPHSIDAAMQTPEGRHVFFKGNRHYFYDDYYFNVEIGYPKHNRDHWFQCEVSCRRRGGRQRHRSNGRQNSVVDLRNLGRS